MFAVTLDTDWVPQFVLDDVLDIIESEGVKATVFCTSRYDFSGRRGIEAGIHPNFLPGTTQGDSEQGVLNHLLERYPEATGCRTHRLYWHGGLFEALSVRNIRYDSSLGMFLHPHLEPISMLGITRFPIWWEDDVHLHSALDLSSFSVPRMREPGLKICTFHPLLVYLNSKKVGDYRPAVQGCSSFRELQRTQLMAHRQGGAGLRSFFLQFLKHVKESQDTTCTLQELL